MRLCKNDKKAQICIHFSQTFYRLIKILIIHLDIHRYHPNFKRIIQITTLGIVVFLGCCPREIDSNATDRSVLVLSPDLSLITVKC